MISRKNVPRRHAIVEITEFFVTQILREIKVGEYRVSKSAILTHLEALNFDLLRIFALFEG